VPGPQSSNALAVGIPGTVYRTDGLTTARFSGRRNRCRAVDQLRCERTGAPETRTPASDALLRSCLISSARQKRCCALTRAGAPRLRPRCLPVALTPSSPRPRAPPPQSLSQDYPLSPASPRALRPPSRPTPLWVVPPPSRLLLWVGGKALAGNGWGEGWRGGGERGAPPRRAIVSTRLRSRAGASCCSLLLTRRPPRRQPPQLPQWASRTGHACPGGSRGRDDGPRGAMRHPAGTRRRPRS